MYLSMTAIRYGQLVNKSRSEAQKNEAKKDKEESASKQ